MSRSCCCCSRRKGATRARCARVLHAPNGAGLGRALEARVSGQNKTGQARQWRTYRLTWRPKGRLRWWWPWNRLWRGRPTRCLRLATRDSQPPTCRWRPRPAWPKTPTLPPGDGNASRAGWPQPYSRLLLLRVQHTAAATRAPSATRRASRTTHHASRPAAWSCCSCRSLGADKPSTASCCRKQLRARWRRRPRCLSRAALVPRARRATLSMVDR